MEILNAKQEKFKIQGSESKMIKGESSQTSSILSKEEEKPF